MIESTIADYCIAVETEEVPDDVVLQVDDEAAETDAEAGAKGCTFDRIAASGLALEAVALAVYCCVLIALAFFYYVERAYKARFHKGSSKLGEKTSFVPKGKKAVTAGAGVAVGAGAVAVAVDENAEDAAYAEGAGEGEGDEEYGDWDGY